MVSDSPKPLLLPANSDPIVAVVLEMNVINSPFLHPPDVGHDGDGIRVAADYLVGL